MAEGWAAPSSSRTWEGTEVTTVWKSFFFFFFKLYSPLLGWKWDFGLLEEEYFSSMYNLTDLTTTTLFKT